MTAVRSLLVLLTLTLAATGRARAQTDARLVAALKLAQDGQADSARAITRGLLTKIPASDTLYPQVLFTAASVSATSPEMEKALRRIIVEYPSSEWVDDALLRLAQIDYAGGDVSGAAEKLERLRTDFPSSALLPPASLWAARSYFELRNRTAACKWLQEGRARVGTDVEIGNQLTFYAQRCAPGALMADAPTMDTVKMAKGDSVAVPKTSTPAKAVPAAVAAKDSTKPAPKTSTPAKTVPAAVAANDSMKPAPKPSTPAVKDTAPPAPKPAAAGAFRLQIAAMQTAEQAADLVRTLKAKGIDADVTIDGVYHKVRTGRYATLAAATAAMAGVAQKAGSAPFVVRAGN